MIQDCIIVEYIHQTSPFSPCVGTPSQSCPVLPSSPYSGILTSTTDTAITNTSTTNLSSSRRRGFGGTVGIELHWWRRQGNISLSSVSGWTSETTRWPLSINWLSVGQALNSRWMARDACGFPGRPMLNILCLYPAGPAKRGRLGVFNHRSLGHRGMRRCCMLTRQGLMGRMWSIVRMASSSWGRCLHLSRGTDDFAGLGGA